MQQWYLLFLHLFLWVLLIPLPCPHTRECAHCASLGEVCTIYSSNWHKIIHYLGPHFYSRVMAPSGAIAVFTISLINYAIGQAEFPNNTTVFMNQRALFRCVAPGTPLYMYWKVNGTAFNQLESDIRGDMGTEQVTVGDNEELTLTIPGRAEYNGTRVQCVAGDEGGEDESENATLSIQGLLSSVEGLVTISNTSSINISWTAPFSLDVTDVDPDIWYSVLIYNVTDEDIATTIPCTKCINIIETYFTFTPDHFGPCQMYNFTVIPYNGAGQGESSLNVSAISHEKPSTLFSMTGVRAVNKGSECNVTFQVLGDVGSGCKYTLRIAGGVDGAIPISTAELEEFGGYFSYPLPADRRYTTSFEIETADGIKDNVNITYTTFDVQNVTVEENGGSIAVTGKFLTDTFAMGCFIVVQFNESTADEFIALLRNESKQTVHKTINVLSSTYKLYAYDIEDNGLPNETPAIVQEHEKYISTHYSMFNSNSTILTTTSISVNGSQVIIDCEFADKCALASCVLIYREYGDASLTVIDYNRTTVFPVSVSVDQPENFTFALFGRNCKGEIEESPAIQLKFDATKTSLPDNSSQMGISALVGGTMAVLVLVAIGVTITVFIVRSKKQSAHVQYPVQGYQDQEMGEITSDNGTAGEEVERDGVTTTRMATEGVKEFAAHGSQGRNRIAVYSALTSHATIPNSTTSNDSLMRRRAIHKTDVHSGNKEE